MTLTNILIKGRTQYSTPFCNINMNEQYFFVWDGYMEALEGGHNIYIHKELMFSILWNHCMEPTNIVGILVGLP